MKKGITFIICLFVLPNIVKANIINSIKMDIYVDDNGNANITEIWDAYLDNGTEGFHSYGDIGQAYLSDLSVSMDGYRFDIVDEWDINNSFELKKYSAYLGRINSEYGVYFGISEYGRHEYQISYKINNFIVRLKDANMLYWNLVPQQMGSDIGQVDICIYGNNLYSNDLDVWGYGKYGALAYVSDGKIYISATDVRESDYITLLVKYPLDMFNTEVSINKSFNYFLDLANEGTINYNEKTTLLEKIIGYIFLFILFIPIIVVILIISKIKSVSSRDGLRGYHTQGSGSYQNKRCDFGERGNIISKDILPYRDIPTKDILRAYWIIYNYDLGVKDEDILGAYLLKWIREGYIKLEKEDIKKKVTNVLFVNHPNNVN